MNKVNALLNERLQKKEKHPKVKALAEKTHIAPAATLTPPSLNASELNEHEKERLAAILEKYSSSDSNESLQEDLYSLQMITSEVKAINNQAIILHGERIQRAQRVLKNYREGAFTAWLIATYGNRQTPYNFLQYYEFYASMPQQLHNKIETMPRQAVYTLASRQGEIEKKRSIVEHYQGESKEDVLQTIRSTFPLSYQDKRRHDAGETAINLLSRVAFSLSSTSVNLKDKQRHKIVHLLNEIKKLVK